MARLAIFKLITAVVVAILCYVYAPFHPLPAILISSVGLAITFFVSLANQSAHPSVEEYYTSFESRLGYYVLLGNTRHCGFWPAGTVWPFRLSKALRAMEEKLYQRLNLPAASKVLDAGAGSGIVACYMAEQHHLQITGIDMTAAHVEDARKVIQRNGLECMVSVQKGNYHDLSSFGDTSFDGIYTMETFVHADDPMKALGEFYRVLKPGGVLVMHEGEFHWDSPTLQTVLRLSHCENTLKQGSYTEFLTRTGFNEITVEDLSDNVLPLWRLFAVLGGGPYAVLKLLGLHERFTNLMAGVETYRHWDQGRHISVRATKA